MTPLTSGQIATAMRTVPAWAHQAKTITRTYKFDDFLMSIAFVHRIAKRAEKLQHHPDIDIRYNKVTLTNTTHDAGGLTAKDFDLAEQCDVVFAKFLEE